MSSEDINRLYAAYRRDCYAGQEPLLEAIRNKAAKVLHDQDAVQDFILGVWQELTALTINESFSGWLRRRLYWTSIDLRRASTANREQQVPEMFGDDGERLPDGDTLDILAYRQEPARMTRDLSSISDPFIRQVAGLLLEGHTTTEAAHLLSVNPSTLRTRLQRFRARVRQK